MSNTVIVAVCMAGLPAWYVPVTLPHGEVGRGWTGDIPGQVSTPPAVGRAAVRLARARAAERPLSVKSANIRPKPASVEAIRVALQRFGGTARTTHIAAASGYCVAACTYILPHVARRVRRGVWSLT